MPVQTKIVPSNRLSSSNWRTATLRPPWEPEISRAESGIARSGAMRRRVFTARTLSLPRLIRYSIDSGSANANSSANSSVIPPPNASTARHVNASINRLATSPAPICPIEKPI